MLADVMIPSIGEGVRLPTNSYREIKGPPQKWGHAPEPPVPYAKLAVATLGNYVLRCRSLALT